MNTEAKEGEMYCAVEGCGLVDETRTAYCIKHGRVTHRIKGQSNESSPPTKPEKLPPNALVDIYAQQQLDTLDKQKEEKENVAKTRQGREEENART